MLQDLRRPPTVGVEDLVMLPQLTEKSIMENLKQRHGKDLIYSNIGSVLISVNPFKRLPIYTPEYIAMYRTAGKATGSPHIFSLAEDAYRMMVREEENQCVIISGESGAGKTEASKQIMQYVAAVSGNSADMARVKEIMLQSNPILESFGNAKTVRNDNSSRFGKFFEVYFDTVGGPVGGKMSNFLLEKSRVVRQQKGERNFHIFYQLCCGADASLTAALKLRPPSQFNYLNQGGTLTRSGIDDAGEFKETREAMQCMGMSQEDQMNVFKLLAAILHLGEITFKKVGDDSNEVCAIEKDDELIIVADLLKIPTENLRNALLFKKLEMRSEIVSVSLDMQQCINTRDAIAKIIYDKLFNYIIYTVNLAFGTKRGALMLGILDIYGFEIFDKNGFEQFCINYVNEKLQQIFIELTLKVEQEEYVRENIPWEEIPYFNNRIVCELIDGKSPPGLFSVIDDVCLAMAKEKESAADIKMLEKLEGAHGSHRHFKRTEKGFMIKHYAGDVHYDAAGFTTRNKDILSQDVIVVLASSTNVFFTSIMEDVLAMLDTGSSVGARKKSTTAGYKIRQQADELVATLKKCNPHYVRTIKSNDEKLPNTCDDARVLHQVKYLGLLENVRVRRAGYSYRQYFDRFLRRFKYICPATFPRPFRGTDRDACMTILQHAAVAAPQGTWQLGTTKVFIRNPQQLFALEDAREGAFGSLVYKIQRAWMKFRNRREYIVLKSNTDRMYKKGGKERRADSVFRPYLGDYLHYRTNLEALHPLVEFDVVASAWKEFWSDTGMKFFYNLITQKSQWQRPVDLDKPRIIFCDRVQRLTHYDRPTGPVLETEIFILSERAIHLIHSYDETIVTPPTKPTRQNPRPPPPPAPYVVRRDVVRKRLDLRLLLGLSVSACADSVVALHWHPQPTPTRPVIPTQPAEEPKGLAKGTKGTKGAPQAAGPLGCEGCGIKFTAAVKRQNCPGCGSLMCLKGCLVHGRPLPTLGYPKEVKVCSRCVVGEPLEPHEDVVILSPFKSEIVAMVRKVYKKFMGCRIPVNISNSITFQLAYEAQPRVVTIQKTPGLQDTTVTNSGRQIIVAAPEGITQGAIAELEARREERRRIAQERYRKEQEEQRQKEEQREKERDAAHKQMVEERKRAKKEAEEKAEEERLRLQSEVANRRIASQRIVEERSSK